MEKAFRPNNLIALLTDFGGRDGFVGTMKGVILGINPRARIVDLSHEIPPQDIEAAAYVLWSSFAYFPAGTIFVCIIDPGVGTGRRVFCAQGEKHLFLAPDNGLLKYLVADGELQRIWEVANSKYVRPRISSTFHGRDIFAPVAARLSLGLDPAKLGASVIMPPARKEFTPLDRWQSGRLSGRIIYVDRFGNLITNFRAYSGEVANSRKLHIRLRGREIRGLVASYAEGGGKKPLALINSANLLEIGIRNASAAGILKTGVGEKVTVEWL